MVKNFITRRDRTLKSFGHTKRLQNLTTIYAGVNVLLEVLQRHRSVMSSEENGDRRFDQDGVKEEVSNGEEKPQPEEMTQENSEIQEEKRDENEDKNVAAGSQEQEANTD